MSRYEPSLRPKSRSDEMRQTNCSRDRTDHPFNTPQRPLPILALARRLLIADWLTGCVWCAQTPNILREIGLASVVIALRHFLPHCLQTDVKTRDAQVQVSSNLCKENQRMVKYHYKDVAIHSRARRDIGIQSDGRVTQKTENSA